MNRCIVTPEAPKLQDSRAASPQAESAKAANLALFPHTLAPKPTLAHSHRIQRALAEIYRGSGARLRAGVNLNPETTTSTGRFRMGDRPSNCHRFRRAFSPPATGMSAVKRCSNLNGDLFPNLQVTSSRN